MNIISKKILIIDNDKDMVEDLNIFLTNKKFIVKKLENGKNIMKDFLEFNPDLILLEINIPKINGIKLLQCIKRKKNVPIIILTNKGDIFHKVCAFENGCDDYILKSVEFEELSARINNVLNRYSDKDDNEKSTVKVDDLYINPLSHTVMLNNRNIKMTKKEFELFYILAKDKNKLMTKKQLLYDIWGYKHISETNMIDCNIKRIVEKTKGYTKLWSIELVGDIGYRFFCKDKIVNYN